MASAATRARPGTAVCPALESGDRMDAAEFHWRYSHRPDIKKAELIDGVVYVASPVSSQHHGQPHFELVGALWEYARRTPGVVGDDNATIRVGLRQEPQPDIMLRWDEAHGGTSSLDATGFVRGAPELVAEVSYSSRSHDLSTKKELYRSLGVREYLVWQVEEARVDWWRLADGEYVALEPDGAGQLHSAVFPGLALDVRALLAKFPAADLPPRPRSRRRS